MKSIRRTVFLIHPLTWASQAHRAEWVLQYGDYLDYEAVIAQRWRDGIRDLASEPESLLVMVSPAPDENLAALAVQELGPRAVILREYVPSRPPDERTHHASCLDLAERLRGALAERGLEYDAGTVRPETWGESFEGCAANYGRHLGRALGFSRPADPAFDMTVPDYRILHTAHFLGVEETDGARLYRWETITGRQVAWFHAGPISLSDPPRFVRVCIRDMRVEVRTYGELIWPIADSICRLEGDRLTIPIWGIPTGRPVWNTHFVLAHGTDSTRFHAAMKRAEIHQEINS